MKRFVVLIFITLQFLALFENVSGHGILLDPIGRSSRWRKDPTAPANYDDNQNYCGGLQVQIMNGGKCGICGDNYKSRTPRNNELGGIYGGSGVIVQTYTSNTADVSFRIDNNHLGYVYFELCNLDEFGSESEECFAQYRLKFADGRDKLNVGTKSGVFSFSVVLPNGVHCAHCVIRWTYYGGNNWNPCVSGGGQLGCGPQETFKHCADVSIA